MYECVENELHDTIFLLWYASALFTNFDSFVILVYIHVSSAGAEIVLEKWGAQILGFVVGGGGEGGLNQRGH